VSLKSAVRQSCLPITCPASNGAQAIARVCLKRGLRYRRVGSGRLVEWTDGWLGF